MVHDEALGKEMQLILKDDTQFYKLFVENDSFRGEWREMIPIIFRAMPLISLFRIFTCIPQAKQRKTNGIRIE